MPYSITESLQDLAKRIEAEKVIQDHYPDAYYQKVGDAAFWVSPSLAKQDTTHFITTQSNQTAFWLYKKLTEDARIFYKDPVHFTTFVFLAKQLPEAHAALLAILKM